MRVLYLCHRHQDTQIGGLAEFLYFLPSALKAWQVEPYIYTQSVNKNDAQLSGPILLDNCVPSYSGPFLKPAFFPSKKSLQPLLQLCHHQQVDLIHTQGTYRAGFMAMHIHKHTRIPYVVTSHSDILTINSERMRRRHIQGRCHRILQHAAQVTHLTTFMEHASASLCNTHLKNTIIGNGIDFTIWKNYQAMPEQNYMLAIGRLEPEKGFHVIIDAYAQLTKQKSHMALVIAGTGSVESSLHAQATRLGLTVITQFNHVFPPNSVIFTGYVKKTMKMQLFAGAQMVLFAPQPHTWEEAFGIVQLEAMAAGKVLIASDIPQTRYLQTKGLQAALVKANDIDAWTMQMLRFINDATLRQSWGEKNRNTAEQFDWRNIAKQYYAVYQKAIGLQQFC